MRARTAHLQSRGQFGARDFDKVAWTLPIPRFNASIGLHADLAAAGRAAETLAAEVPLGNGIRFQRARKLIREALIEAGVASRIETLVTTLLGE